MFKGEGRSTLEDYGHQLGRGGQLVSQNLCQPHVENTMKMRASRNYRDEKNESLQYLCIFTDFNLRKNKEEYVVSFSMTKWSWRLHILSVIADH